MLTQLVEQEIILQLLDSRQPRTLAQLQSHVQSVFLGRLPGDSLLPVCSLTLLLLPPSWHVAL